MLLTRFRAHPAPGPRPLLVLPVVPVLLLVALLVAGAPIAAQTPPLGSEFQVNTTTALDQQVPSVAIGADGFVVVWQNASPLGMNDDDVRGRRFAADGSPIGTDFQVNTYSTGYQGVPSVAVAPDGGFVVVWQSYGASTIETRRIQGQRYAADGSPIGAELQVNAAATAIRRIPSVAATPGGGFVVVWETRPAADPASDSEIWGRRFAADGSPIGAEVQLNGFTTSFQVSPEVAATPDGGFVVAWTSLGSAGNDSSQTSVQARRFAADGTPIGDEFQVNTYVFLFQSSPAVTVARGGEFVVAWNSYGSDEAVGNDTSAYSVQARRFAADGSPLGDDFQVNTSTTGNQILSAVAAGPEGDFLVVWSSEVSTGSDASAFSIQGQRFDPDGSRRGAEQQLNTSAIGSQSFPDVVGAADGSQFVVVWQSDSSAAADASGLSVQGQRLRGDGIFADGFESGDTLRWSASVP